MHTKPETMIKALNVLANEIESPDGVANACIAEAASMIEEMNAFISKLSELDNIPEWISQSAKDLTQRDNDN